MVNIKGNLTLKNANVLQKLQRKDTKKFTKMPIAEPTNLFQISESEPLLNEAIIIFKYFGLWRFNDKFDIFAWIYRKFWQFMFLFVFGLGFNIVLVSGPVIFIYEKNFDDFLYAFVLMYGMIIMQMKLCFLTCNEAKIRNILNMLKGLCLKFKDLSTVKMGLRVYRKLLYVSIASLIVTVAIFLSTPFLAKQKNQKLDFCITFKTYDFMYQTPYFEILSLWIGLSFFFPCVLQAIYDAFFIGILIVEKEVVKSIREELKNHCNSGTLKEESLLDNVKKLNKALNIFKDIKNTFKFITFFHLIGDALIIVLCLYSATQSSSTPRFWPSFLSVISFYIPIFLYCQFGEAICTEIEDLSKEYYSTNWYLESKKFKSIILTILYILHHNTNMKAGGLVPLSRGTIMIITKSSISYYTFLLAVAGM